MSILKLANAGDEATLEISRCAVVEGQYGEQVIFETDEPETLYLPKASADRQLERIGLSYDAAVGATLHFSRTPNPKPGAKPFWNINVAKPNGKPPIAAPAFPRAGSVQPHPTGAPPKSPPSFASKPEADLPEYLRDANAQEAADLHAKLVGQVDIPEQILVRREAYATAQLQTVRIALEMLEPEYRKHEIGMTDDVIHKHAFELFKLWADKGLIG